MTISAVAAFWAVSFLLVLVPGADWAYAIAAGLRDRSVLPAVSGLLVGYVALTLVVAAGVGVLVLRWPLALTALTALGALYLTGLGLATLTRRPAPLTVTADVTRSRRRQLAKGTAISALNPKALLMFLALLPQFATRAGAVPFAVQVMILGLTHTMNCGAVYTSVAIAARRVLRARPAAAVAVARGSGAAMIAIGVFLLVECGHGVSGWVASRSW